MRTLAIALACSACGRIGFDPGTATPDGADGPLGPFGTATPIGELSGLRADDAVLSDDELELWFTSQVAGCDVMTMTRASTDLPWAVPTNAFAIADCHSTAATSGDGLTMWLSIFPGGGGDLHESRRASRSDPWQTPTLVPELSAPDPIQDVGASVTGDELTIFFYSNRGSSFDIYTATRASIGIAWSTPVRVDELSSSLDDKSPHISRDGLTIWFSRKPAAGTQEDLWVATRASPADPFGTPVVVTELNTADEEDDPWVSTDGRRIYFTRRNATTSAVYTASR